MKKLISIAFTVALLLTSSYVNAQCSTCGNYRFGNYYGNNSTCATGKCNANYYTVDCGNGEIAPFEKKKEVTYRFVDCHKCGKKIKVNVTINGKKFKCPCCKDAIFLVVDHHVWGNAKEYKEETIPCSPCGPAKQIVKESVTCIDNITQRLLNGINATRARFGRSPITYSEEISSGAQAHSNEMAMRCSMYHAYNLGGCSENVAAGQTTPEQAANDWANSSGHLRNILNARSCCGIGYAKGNNGWIYWTLRLR